MAAAFVSILLAPAASPAAEVWLQEGFGCDENLGCWVEAAVKYSADEVSEVNTVSLSRMGPRRVVLHDETAVVTAGTGCTSVSLHEAICEAYDNGEMFADHNFVSGDVFLGDFDDSVTVSGVPVWVWGGDGNDTITDGEMANRLMGHGGVDTLHGGGGDDVLDGGSGADTLDGGPRVDTITYRWRGAAVAVRLDGQRNDGADPNQSGISSSAEEGDLDIDIEDAEGSPGNDRLVGSDAPNVLDGGAGNDRLEGGAGADVLDGSTGTDTMSYAGRPVDQPVAARLDGLANDGADLDRNGFSTAAEEGDRDIAIENAIAGSGHDFLFGDATVNMLTGGPGADRLDGGLGGDLLDGGTGSDTITYATRAAGDRVAIRLDGYRNDGSDPNRNGLSGSGEEGDRDISVENGIGGAGPDYILSPLAGPNILSGLGGDDRIFARDGTAAKDTVNCGAGADRYQTDPSDATASCETVIP